MTKLEHITVEQTIAELEAHGSGFPRWPHYYEARIRVPLPQDPSVTVEAICGRPAMYLETSAGRGMAKNLCIGDTRCQEHHHKSRRNDIFPGFVMRSFTDHHYLGGPKGGAWAVEPD